LKKSVEHEENDKNEEAVKLIKEAKEDYK